MKIHLNIRAIINKVRKLKKRTWIIIIASIVMLVVLAIVVFPKSVNVATTGVVKGEFIIDRNTSGEIDALNSTNVSLPRVRRRMSYKIIDMVDEGIIVEKDDFLLQVDNAEALQKVDEANDELENAKAQLESEKATIASNMAQINSQLESQKYSYEQAKLSLKMMQFEAEARKQEYELNMKMAEVSLEQAKEKIKSQNIIDKATLLRAELNVRQAEAELREAEKALGALTLTAPIGGLVVYKEIWSSSGLKKVQIGDTPWPGMPIIGIPDLSVMQAKTTVNETDISKIEKGQNAVVTVDALEGKAYYGKITRVAALARREKSTNVKVFDIEVTLDSTDGLLRPGMTCGCRIFTGRIPDALSVPLQSVFQKEGKTVVYVTETRGPKVREVKVGEKSSDMIVILEGLEDGENICLRDPTIPLDEIGIESEAAQTTAPKPNRSSGNRDGMKVIMH